MTRQSGRPVGFEWQDGSSEYSRYTEKYRRPIATPIKVAKRQNADLQVPRRSRRAPMQQPKPAAAINHPSSDNASSPSKAAPKLPDLPTVPKSSSVEGAHKPADSPTIKQASAQSTQSMANLLFSEQEAAQIAKSHKKPRRYKKPRTFQKPPIKVSRWTPILRIIAVLILIGAVYLAIDTIKTNQAIKDATGTASNHKNFDSDKPSVSDSNGPPRSIEIPKLNLAAPVESLGAKPNGEIDAPKELGSVGYFNKSSLPGKGGTIFMDGHTGTTSVPGIFDNLHTLQAGDVISVERSDKLVARYKVMVTESKNLADINMNELLKSDKKQPEKLVLMTCAGNYDGAAKTYDKRVIVYAEAAK